METQYTGGHDFTNVDKANAAEMISYLDRITGAVGQGKRAGYAALGIAPGMSVLDVGCGTGDDVRVLSEIVGPRGHVAGVDFSQSMIDEAIKRGIPSNAELRQASATELPFMDETFDAARSERVFQHLEHPEAAARELYRVLKPGGGVMLIDQDWETLIVAGSNKALTRTICNAFTDHPLNGWAGRNHPGLLRRAGFHDVAVQPVPVALPFPVAMQLILTHAITYAVRTSAVSAHDAASFAADLQMADERGEFYCAFTIFAATGRR